MTLLIHNFLSVLLLSEDSTQAQSLSWVVWVAFHVGAILLVVVSVALAMSRRRLMESERELDQLREEMERVEERMVASGEAESEEVASGEAEAVKQVEEIEPGSQGEIVEMYVNMSMTHSDKIFLTRLIHYVEQNIDRADLTVSSLCDFMGVTPLLLNKKLKALIGMTAIVFIRTIRLRRAAILLRTSRYTVADVTYDVGFSDLRYFRECFKKEFGVLPQEYKGAAEA